MNHKIKFAWHEIKRCMKGRRRRCGGLETLVRLGEGVIARKLFPLPMSRIEMMRRGIVDTAAVEVGQKGKETARVLNGILNGGIKKYGVAAG
jgi:hypothetical protein